MKAGEYALNYLMNILFAAGGLCPIPPPPWPPPPLPKKLEKLFIFKYF
jgi:hypothetical protein